MNRIEEIEVEIRYTKIDMTDIRADMNDNIMERAVLESDYENMVCELDEFKEYLRELEDELDELEEMEFDE